MVLIIQSWWAVCQACLAGGQLSSERNNPECDAERGVSAGTKSMSWLLARADIKCRARVQGDMVPGESWSQIVPLRHINKAEIKDREGLGQRL